jgi:hypothetical protein
MTPEQLLVLKAGILAETDPAFVALRQANDETGMVNWYNADSAFVVRRSSVLSSAIGPVLNYVAVSSLTTANRDRATTFVLLNPVSFIPTADIESYWDTTFGGALGGQGENTRAALQALWRRTVNRVELLFCTGTGTQVSPGALGTFEGTIRAQDISDALRA